MLKLPSLRGCGIAGLLTFTVLSVSTAHADISGPDSCSGDVNGDGMVDVDDLFEVLAAWGETSPGGMGWGGGGGGVIGIDALFTVIANWGPCPAGAIPGAAVPLFCENFESGTYANWSMGYTDWSACAFNDFAADQFVSGSQSHRSNVVCTATQSHRGYGMLRFEGDLVVPHMAIPSSGGIESPHGAVITFWSRLSVQYSFGPPVWMSLMTITDDCNNGWANVLGLNIDDWTGRLKPAHVDTVDYIPNAPSFPHDQWNRTTVYVNYYEGVMHVWQNGQYIVTATFSRPGTDLCQFHFGLYASPENDNVVLYEDDISIVKLLEPWTDLQTEPWFPELIDECNMAP